MLNDTLTNAETPTAAAALVTPALITLYKAREGGQRMNSLGLIHAIERMTALHQTEQAVASGDRLTAFQRQVINVIHNTLVREGYVRAGSAHFDPSAELTLTVKGERLLARNMLDAFGPLREAPDREEGRVSETTLKGPAMFLILKMGLERAQQEGKSVPQPVPMTELRTNLRALVPKSAEDLAPLAGRTDSKVDQVIRNLVSNDSLTSYGWAKRVGAGLQITDAGMREVLGHLLKGVPTPPVHNQAIAADRPTQPATPRRARSR